jgi:hypothetical protein
MNKPKKRRTSHSPGKGAIQSGLQGRPQFGRPKAPTLDIERESGKFSKKPLSAQYRSSSFIFRYFRMLRWVLIKEMLMPSSTMTMNIALSRV